MVDPKSMTTDELIREGVKTWPVENYAARLTHELASRLEALREAARDMREHCYRSAPSGNCIHGDRIDSELSR